MFVRTAHADYIYDYDWAPHLSIIVVANAKFGGGGVEVGAGFIQCR